MFRRIWSFSKPLIATVQGAALAGGSGIATLCDFTLAAPDATFGYTEVRIGFLPALVSVFLTRQIGDKRARDLLLTGRKLTAAEAKELGLVNEIVPAESLTARAHELAAVLIAASPSSLTRAKWLLTAAAAQSVVSTARIVSLSTAICSALRTAGAPSYCSSVSRARCAAPTYAPRRM